MKMIYIKKSFKIRKDATINYSCVLSENYFACIDANVALA